MSIRPINNQFAGMRANPINLDSATHYPKAWHLPHWKKGDDTTRMKVLREISMRGGRDPRIATLCVQIFKEQGVVPRNYKEQARALLKWVQKNIYYVNEPSERLQDPIYTIKVGYGDCDDMAILLASMFESCKLEWRFVLSGKVKGKSTRWIEGTPLPKGGQWAHIYLVVGYPPFRPSKWLFAEPTLQHVDLGWDIIQAQKRGENPLPEMGTFIQDGNIVSEQEFSETERKSNIVERIKGLFTLDNLFSDVVYAAVVAVLVDRLVDKINDRFSK